MYMYNEKWRCSKKTVFQNDRWWLTSAPLEDNKTVSFFNKNFLVLGTFFAPRKTSNLLGESFYFEGSGELHSERDQLQRKRTHDPSRSSLGSSNSELNLTAHVQVGKVQDWLEGRISAPWPRLAGKWLVLRPWHAMLRGRRSTFTVVHMCLLVRIPQECLLYREEFHSAITGSMSSANTPRSLQ